MEGLRAPSPANVNSDGEEEVPRNRAAWWLARFANEGGYVSGGSAGDSAADVNAARVSLHSAGSENGS